MDDNKIVPFPGVCMIPIRKDADVYDLGKVARKLTRRAAAARTDELARRYKVVFFSLHALAEAGDRERLEKIEKLARSLLNKMESEREEEQD